MLYSCHEQEQRSAALILTQQRSVLHAQQHLLFKHHLPARVKPQVPTHFWGVNKFECQFTVTLYWTPNLFTSSSRIKIRKWGWGGAKHSHSINRAARSHAMSTRHTHFTVFSRSRAIPPFSNAENLYFLFLNLGYPNTVIVRHVQ